MATSTSIYGVLAAFVLVQMISCRPQVTSPLPVTDMMPSSAVTDPKISDSKKTTKLPSPRAILIEEFKSKVLRHLNKTGPPVNGISTPKLPKEVIAHLSEQHILSDAKLKEDILIRPSNSNSSCLTKVNCSRFEFIASQDIDSMISVQLLFYKIDIMQNLSVTVYSSMAEDADPVIKLKEYHSKSRLNSGLVTFELPKILALESKNGEVRCTVEVEGSSVYEDGEYSPILILTKTVVKEEKSSRTARSNGNCKDCCHLESFFVTVEELGWESWIVQPQTFNIGNCAGHCTETLTFYKSQYQTIRNTLSKRNNTRFPKPDCAFWAPKCKPAQLLPQDIMYDNNGTVIHDQIPYMVVESCQCS